MMATRNCVLAVDLGTTGLKVGLVTASGEVVAYEASPIQTRYIEGGGAVQDPHAWWRAILDASRRLIGGGHARPEEIVAVSCTGQWGSTVPVGEHGQAIGECILWMDTRGHPYSSAVLGGKIAVAGYDPVKAARFIRKSGGAPSPLGNDPLGHILFLRNEEPELYRSASVFLEPVDYLTMCFTGRVAATPASMILSWLVDIRRLDRPSYDLGLLAACTLDPSKLPDLLATGEVVGVARQEVCEEIGLPYGVPVVSGTPDLLSAAVGTGALGDYEPHLAISTTSWLSCHVLRKKTDPLRQIATVPGVVRGRFLLANNHETAGACLAWLREAVLLPANGLPGSSGGSPLDFNVLTALAERSPIGSGGVIFAPWLAGERCPVDDRTVRGSFVNLSLGTDRSSIVRSVLEGVAYNARWMLDAVERFIGRPAGPIRVLGGGAQSDLWCQIHADVMGKTLERVADPLLVNLKGAGLFAQLSLGGLQRSEMPAKVVVDRAFHPDSSAGGIYKELYREFKGLYRKQRRMYVRLNGKR